QRGDEPALVRGHEMRLEGVPDRPVLAPRPGAAGQRAQEQQQRAPAHDFAGFLDSSGSSQRPSQSPANTNGVASTATGTNRARRSGDSSFGRHSNSSVSSQTSGMVATGCTTARSAANAATPTGRATGASATFAPVEAGASCWSSRLSVRRLSLQNML